MFGVSNVLFSASLQASLAIKPSNSNAIYCILRSTAAALCFAFFCCIEILRFTAATFLFHVGVDEVKLTMSPSTIEVGDFIFSLVAASFLRSTATALLFHVCVDNMAVVDYD
jgi:hypothetical protein